MRIVGIDCGTEKTGYGVVESDGRCHRLISAGVIRTKPSNPLERRLHQIAIELRGIVQQFQPDCCAVEEVFHSVNAKSALKLAHVRGIALLVAAENELGLYEYSPLEVKISVVGYGRAEKHQVQMMVHSLLGIGPQFRFTRRDRCSGGRNMPRYARPLPRPCRSESMRSVILALACATSLLASVPTLTYTRSFPGSVPAYFCINIDRSGALLYKESPTDDQPLKAQLPESDVESIFSMAEKLGYFKTPLESGLKVANTGKKTFRYEDASGSGTEATFNFSTNETAQQLLTKFEDIGESERAYIELERTLRYDHLGINDALAQVETLWLNKQLAAPKQFVPLLTKISTRETLMHLVRDRAARLKDEFEAGPRPSADSKQQ